VDDVKYRQLYSPGQKRVLNGRDAKVDPRSPYANSGKEDNWRRKRTLTHRLLKRYHRGYTDSDISISQIYERERERERTRRETKRRMASSGMLRRVALVRTDVSEEPIASFIRVTGIGELGTTLAVTSNRRTLRRNTCHPDKGGATFNRNVSFYKSHTA
jgi:hypothetical protein